MVRVKLRGNNPDNLDPVFDAYRCLKAIFEAAEVVENYAEVDGEMVYIGDMLKLPGSGEWADPDDLNPLNGLERWLAERVAQDVANGGGKP